MIIAGIVLTQQIQRQNCILREGHILKTLVAPLTRVDNMCCSKYQPHLIHEDVCSTDLWASTKKKRKNSILQIVATLPLGRRQSTSS
jgi:hypothetical protein